MTEIKVKPLDELYFDEAESNGHVYGTFHKYVRGKWTKFFLFAWLGKKVNYRGPVSCDSTRHKKFINCTVRVAFTQELLDAEKFEAEETEVTIILYW